MHTSFSGASPRSARGRRISIQSLFIYVPYSCDATKKLIFREAVGLEEREVEAQWLDLVRDVRAHGALGRCLPLCDVSASMMGQPMDVAIALSLLLSELASEPWRCLERHEATELSTLFHHISAIWPEVSTFGRKSWPMAKSGRPCSSQ